MVSSSRKKGGVDAFENDPSFMRKGTVYCIEVQPRRPIFEKCSHLREKGGVLTQIRAHGE
jgi:hypothetical protein